jgi:hypothetical protein
MSKLEKTPSRPLRRGIYIALIYVLMAALLLFALIFVLPLFTSSPSQSLISFDWAGYSVASNLINPQPEVTRINASWTIPLVNVSTGDSFCATWIGVGGQFDDTLIQVGTEQDSIDGQATYSAWYELLPYDAVTIDSLKILAGDVITVSISLLNATKNTWSIEIHDNTNAQSFQKSVVYNSSMLSAEWMVERPTINNRFATLADFGSITFTGCTATIGSQSGTINSFPSTQVTMYNRQNIKLVSVSSLTSTGSSFTVSYLD